jgi:hypothetical protein
LKQKNIKNKNIKKKYMIKLNYYKIVNKNYKIYNKNLKNKKALNIKNREKIKIY